MLYQPFDALEVLRNGIEEDHRLVDDILARHGLALGHVGEVPEPCGVVVLAGVGIVHPRAVGHPPRRLRQHLVHQLFLRPTHTVPFHHAEFVIVMTTEFILTEGLGYLENVTEARRQKSLHVEFRTSHHESGNVTRDFKIVQLRIRAAGIGKCRSFHFQAIAGHKKLTNLIHQSLTCNPRFAVASRRKIFLVLFHSLYPKITLSLPP